MGGNWGGRNGGGAHSDVLLRGGGVDCFGGLRLVVVVMHRYCEWDICYLYVERFYSLSL